MLMMTILFTPVIAIYKSGNFYGENTVNYNTVQLSLGNLGQREPMCRISYVKQPLGIQNFKCRVGTLSSIIHTGLIPKDEER
jgi:hypothetical protein